MADREREAARGTPGHPHAPGPIASEDSFGKYFTVSYERHVAWTLKEFKSIVRDRDAAEDLVAEAFKNVFPNRAGVTNPDAALAERIRGLAIDKSAKMERSINDTSVVGQAEARLADGQPVDSAYASQECRELFSAEAVRTLSFAERRLYDLYLDEKTHEEIAQILGDRSWIKVRDDLKGIFVKLLDAMSKLVTLDNISLESESAALKSPKAAEEAMGRLPRLLSAIVRLTYVDKLPPTQIALRLKLASGEEVTGHLSRALNALSRLYRAKMPDALIAALAYKPSGGKRKEKDL